MNYLNMGIKFIQDNWLTFVLLATGIILFLKLVADFRVEWAKLTPEKQDDQDAKLFKSKVNIVIKTIKRLFKIGDKKDV